MELVLEAGDDRFWEVVDDALVCLPAGDVLTLSGDVRPEVLVALPVFVLLFPGLLFSAGLRAGAGPVVDKSCGDATPVEDVESAYLQEAAGFCGASKPGDCAPGLAP